MTDEILSKIEKVEFYLAVDGTKCKTPQEVYKRDIVHRTNFINGRIPTMKQEVFRNAIGSTGNYSSNLYTTGFLMKAFSDPDKIKAIHDALNQDFESLAGNEYAHKFPKSSAL